MLLVGLKNDSSRVKERGSILARPQSFEVKKLNQWVGGGGEVKQGGDVHDITYKLKSHFRLCKVSFSKILRYLTVLTTLVGRVDINNVFHSYYG